MFYNFLYGVIIKKLFCIIFYFGFIKVIREKNACFNISNYRNYTQIKTQFCKKSFYFDDWLFYFIWFSMLVQKLKFPFLYHVRIFHHRTAYFKANNWNHEISSFHDDFINLYKSTCKLHSYLIKVSITRKIIMRQSFQNVIPTFLRFLIASFPISLQVNITGILFFFNLAVISYHVNIPTSLISSHHLLVILVKSFTLLLANCT